MKSIINALLLLILPVSLVAQSQQPKNSIQIDTRLYEVYDKDYLEEIKTKDPFLIQYWTFYLDNAFIITDRAGLSKPDEDKYYPLVSIPDLTKVNIMKIETKQNLKQDLYKETVYKIKGTDKYLVYYPNKVFVQKFNAYSGRKY